MKWWPWRRDADGHQQRAEQAEAELRRVQRMTPAYERLADAVTVDPDEFVERLARAFRRHT